MANEQASTFTDLIYDDGAVSRLMESFPHAIVTDASDYIHEERVEVTLPITDRSNYLKDAIRGGYAECSLTVQMLILNDVGGELRQVLDELENERAEAACPTPAPSPRR